MLFLMLNILVFLCIFFCFWGLMKLHHCEDIFYTHFKLFIFILNIISITFLSRYLYIPMQCSLIMNLMNVFYVFERERVISCVKLWLEYSMLFFLLLIVKIMAWLFLILSLFNLVFVPTVDKCKMMMMIVCYLKRTSKMWIKFNWKGQNLCVNRCIIWINCGADVTTYVQRVQLKKIWLMFWFRSPEF